MDGAPATRAILDLLRSPAYVPAVQLTSLVVARLLPMFLLTPVFGGQGVPARLRFGIALAISSVIAYALYRADRPVLSAEHMILLVGKEVLLGLLFAVLLLVLFHALATFGSLVDLARGEGALTVHDPHTQHQQTVLSHFGLQLGATLFLTMGGAQMLLLTLGDSFHFAPVDALLPARLTPGAALPTLLAAAGDMFGVAVRLAAPVLLITLLVDVVLALVGRVAQQVDLSALGLCVKGGLVLILLLFTLGIVVANFRREALLSLERLQLLIGGET